MVSDYRVGQGRDRHRLETGESLVLGGVRIESEKGTVGHSDGDPLIHAIVDALLGAAGLGDIGQHYPKDDPANSNRSSVEFLDETTEQLHSRGWQPVNVDATIVLESVRLGPYRSDITENVLAHLPSDTGFNVKFTTAEGIGPVGRDEAVEAESIVLLRPK